MNVANKAGLAAVRKLAWSVVSELNAGRAPSRTDMMVLAGHVIDEDQARQNSEFGDVVTAAEIVHSWVLYYFGRGSMNEREARSVVEYLKSQQGDVGGDIKEENIGEARPEGAGQGGDVSPRS